MQSFSGTSLKFIFATVVTEQYFANSVLLCTGQKMLQNICYLSIQTTSLVYGCVERVSHRKYNIKSELSERLVCLVFETVTFFSVYVYSCSRLQ